MGNVGVVDRCRCRVADWGTFRRALGLTVMEMAELLCMSDRQVQRLSNQSRHRCPNAASLKHLRSWLRHEAFRERLQRASYPYPWPEDLIVDGAARGRGPSSLN